MALVNLGGTAVEYQIRRSARARNLRITVYRGGKVMVSLPFFYTEKRADSFLCRQSAWVLNSVKKMKKFNGNLDIPKRNRQAFLAHKEEARQFALERLEKFNEFYQCKYNKVFIKNQKTRWGCCSHNGNLHFNYRVMFLPSRLADYIIVHELCHLKQLNHSRGFWALVGRAIPEYKTLRKQLRKGVY